MLPRWSVEAESGGVAQDHGEAGGVCQRDREGLACSSSALIIAGPLVCHRQPAVRGRHKSVCRHKFIITEPERVSGSWEEQPSRLGTGRGRGALFPPCLQ